MATRPWGPITCFSDTTSANNSKKSPQGWAIFWVMLGEKLGLCGQDRVPKNLSSTSTFSLHCRGPAGFPKGPSDSEVTTSGQTIEVFYFWKRVLLLASNSQRSSGVCFQSAGRCAWLWLAREGFKIQGLVTYWYKVAPLFFLVVLRVWVPLRTVDSNPKTKSLIL